MTDIQATSIVVQAADAARLNLAAAIKTATIPATQPLKRALSS
jgi:hypothetical protein